MEASLVSLMAVFGGSVRFSGERPTPCETFHLKHERRGVPPQAVTIVGCCRGPFRGVHRHVIAPCWRLFFLRLVPRHMPADGRYAEHARAATFDLLNCVYSCREYSRVARSRD